MIKLESFDYFGQIPILEQGEYKYINLLGKHLQVDSTYYPSDLNHVAFYNTRANEVFVRVNDLGFSFPFVPKLENVLLIVTPDIKRVLRRGDLVSPIYFYSMSDDVLRAIALK